jgi:hypothetical protein
MKCRTLFHLHLDLPNGFLLPLISPTDIPCTFLVSPILSIYSAQFILLNLITLIILGNERDSWICLQRNFLRPSVNYFCLVDPNILFSSLFSDTFIYVFSSGQENKFHICIKQHKIIILYILSFSFSDTKREDKIFQLD